MDMEDNNMKRNIFIVFIFLIFAGFFFSSCKDEENVAGTDIPITGDDYFPVKTGKIYFNYTELGGASRQWLYFSGQAVWDIYEITKVKDSTFYKIAETKIYTLNSGTPDTVKTNFEIVEDRLHLIYVNRSLGISHNGALSFNRYDSQSRPDTIMRYWNGGYYKLKKNVGLIEIYDTCCGKDYWRYKLMD
jgi:hypothetical protein